MNIFNRISIFAAAALAVCACGTPAQSGSGAKAASAPATKAIVYNFPSIDQGGKVAIVAHRGFWKCEAGGNSQNSIASLKAAQDQGFWGSECDVHITADGVLLVNHDDAINGKLIETHNYADFAKDLLPNGEKRPTLEEYLDQTLKCPTTKLIIELKPHKAQAREDVMVEKTIAALKAKGLYDPNRVLFISFSLHICKVIAASYPQFVNQFLSSEVLRNQNPAKFAEMGINGVDYYYPMFSANPDWIKSAHAKGMSTNAWTVDKTADMQKLIELGIDAITTNEPLETRRLLGSKELKNK